jgi:hypothetical protein
VRPLTAANDALLPASWWDMLDRDRPLLTHFCRSILRLTGQLQTRGYYRIHLKEDKLKSGAFLHYFFYF